MDTTTFFFWLALSQTWNIPEVSDALTTDWLAGKNFSARTQTNPP